MVQKPARIDEPRQKALESTEYIMKKSTTLLSEYHSPSWFEPGGWQELAVVGAAIKQGIFFGLAEREQSAPSLAESLKLDARATQGILEALFSADYLEKTGDQFSLTAEAGARLGDRMSPEYLGWSILHSWRLIERWITLPQVLESGEPVGGDRFSETVEGFVRAMDTYAAPTAERVVDECLQRSAAGPRVLDIGGATGTVSKVFVERGSSATLFDIPAVIETIEAEMRQGFPQIKLEGGDFNDALPDGPYDIAYLGNITHIYGEEKNRSLFKRISDQLETGGLIAILDFVRDRSASAAFFGVNMLVNTADGGTWSETEYDLWLTKAGFEPPEFIDLRDRDQQLIIAKKHEIDLMVV